MDGVKPGGDCCAVLAADGCGVLAIACCAAIADGIFAKGTFTGGTFADGRFIPEVVQCCVPVVAKSQAVGPGLARTARDRRPVLVDRMAAIPMRESAYSARLWALPGMKSADCPDFGDSNPHNDRRKANCLPAIACLQ